MTKFRTCIECWRLVVNSKPLEKFMPQGQQAYKSQLIFLFIQTFI